MKNQTYIRCPRCELNYILKKDKFCNVCKQEMKALGTLGAEENMDMELCPICKVNYINPDEGICFSCAKERENEDGEVKYDSENNWGGYGPNEEEEDINFEDEETGDMASITNLDDSPLGDDDDMDLGLADDDDEPVDEDETFDSDFDETFDDDDLDDDDETFDDDDDDDDLDDDFDSEEGATTQPAKKSRKK